MAGKDTVRFVPSLNNSLEEIDLLLMWSRVLWRSWRRRRRRELGVGLGKYVLLGDLW